MAYSKKKSSANVFLTKADKERIAQMDESSDKIHRKVKAFVTYIHKTTRVKICKYFYGKDKEEIENEVTENIKWFQKKDKAWKLDKLEYIVRKDESSED